MKKAWKWILGIAVLLVVVFAVGFFLSNMWGVGFHTARMPLNSRGPMMDDYQNFRHPMIGEGFNNFRSPMVGRRGFVPLGGFFFLGGLLRLIFPLGVLGLVAYFSYKKGKKDGAALPAPAAPEQPVETSNNDYRQIS